MKYNAFNLNISTDTDIPFLRHGHIQDAEAEIYVFRHSIPYYEQVSCGRNDTWAINAYPEYVITYNRLPESPVIGELTIYTDDIHIFFELLAGKAFSLLLFERNYFLLHASAVVWNGFAYLFSGHSHAGKSTMAFAAYKYLDAAVLCDDIAPMKVLNGKLHIFPGAAKIKMRTVSSAELAPPADLCSDSYIKEDERNYLLDSRVCPVPVKSVIFLNRKSSICEFTYSAYGPTKSRIYLSMNTYGRKALPSNLLNAAVDFIQTNLALFNCRELLYPDDLTQLKNMKLPEADSSET